MLNHITSYIHTRLLYPAARIAVTSQSEQQRWNTLTQKPKVHFEAPYEGRRIMLLALYEKGVLRPDVIRLIKAAREEGLYILGVNTLKLKDPEALEGMIDCYIERPNFGRDFGSYQTGFLHVFNRGWQEQCPRLLMVNDSIFFSEERMPKFLNDLMTSDIEVLGATENYEIEYHLGSFCIAMAQTILQNANFQKYWQEYRLTDVRPRVIKRGEMKLSKTLKRCVSSSTQFRSLYNSTYYLKQLNNDPKLINFVIKNSRTSSLNHWQRFDVERVTKFLTERFMVSANDDTKSKSDVQIDAELAELNKKYLIHDVKSLKKFVARDMIGEFSLIEALVDDALVSIMMRIFMEGSQIHQNAAQLLFMGLPIIKLDGLYRGMFNIYDIQRLSLLLAPDEANEMEEILIERPFGADTLIGWKRAAFLSGLI